MVTIYEQKRLHVITATCCDYLLTLDWWVWYLVPSNHLCKLDGDSWHHNNFHLLPIVDGQLTSTIDTIFMSIQHPFTHWVGPLGYIYHHRPCFCIIHDRSTNVVCMCRSTNRHWLNMHLPEGSGSWPSWKCLCQSLRCKSYCGIYTFGLYPWKARQWPVTIHAWPQCTPD